MDYDLTDIGNFTPEKPKAAPARAYLEKSYIDKSCALALQKHHDAGWHAISKKVKESEEAKSTKKAMKRPLSAVLGVAEPQRKACKKRPASQDEVDGVPKRKGKKVSPTTRYRLANVHKMCLPAEVVAPAMR